VFELKPRIVHKLLGKPFKFRESIVIGHTDFNRRDVKRAIKQLGADFRGDHYHLLNNNCNHFTAALVQTLCGCELPPWVNRLAHMVSCIPGIEGAIPKKWLGPSALTKTTRRTKSYGCRQLTLFIAVLLLLVSAFYYFTAF